MRAEYIGYWLLVIDYCLFVYVYHYFVLYRLMLLVKRPVEPWNGDIYTEYRAECTLSTTPILYTDSMQILLCIHSILCTYTSTYPDRCLYDPPSRRHWLSGDPVAISSGLCDSLHTAILQI